LYIIQIFGIINGSKDVQTYDKSRDQDSTSAVTQSALGGLTGCKFLLVYMCQKL